MIVVIQCAARKQPHAGFMQTPKGQQVYFVADPQEAPPKANVIYARPDDQSDSGQSWRELLAAYHRHPGTNPLGLLPAYALYRHPIYSRLVERFGLDRTFILSAGWGLIAASLLTPNYDITFSASADAWKRRKRADRYADFCMLSESASEDLCLFGGKDYVPMFARLTASYRGRRIVYYNSASPPDAAGCELRRYQTRTRTNWHYECANSVGIAGR